MEYLYELIGNFFFNIYQFIPDYGFAIIILTILIKTLLLPVAIKQQKAMVDMQKVQPHLEEIRKKYKSNPTKLNEETMKLYQEHKVNPLGGCLPALVQFPVIIVLYRVITRPLSYITKFTQEEIDKLVSVVKSIKEIKYNGNELQLINELITNKEKLDIINISDLFSKVEEMTRSMKFLNIIDLGQTPISVFRQIPELMSKTTFTGFIIALSILLIPLVATLTTYLSSKLMSKVNANSSGSGNQMQNSMMMIGPVFTAFFTFTFPAGLGLYFLVSNVFQMVQQYFLNKFIPREVVTKK